MNAERRASLTLFAVAFLILATGAFWGLPSGKAVVGGLVILDGGVPYRDFWTMYAPGQFYAVAALFWLFGRELWVQAIASACLTALAAVVFLRLLRQLGATRRVALGLSSVFVLMFWSTGLELTDYPPALLFLLLALGRVVRYFHGSAANHLRWAGLWLGLAATFKHDIAVYVGIGVATSLFLSWLLVGDRRPSGWMSPVRATLTIATCALAVLAPLVAWTAWTAGAQAWNDLFVFPATVFSKVRGEQFPSLVPDWMPVLNWLSDWRNPVTAVAAVEHLSPWVVLNAPQATFLGGMAYLLAGHRRLDAARLAHLTVLVACMPFFWAAAHIQQNTHPYTLAILGSCAGVVVWSNLDGLTKQRQLLRGLATIAVAVYTAGLLTTPAVMAARAYHEWSGSRTLDLPGFRHVRLPARFVDAFQPVGDFFRSHTREGEPIFAGLVRHDAIVISNTMLYAIAGRPPCCGYTELHPGVGDRASVQQEIIRKVESSGVRAIALWRFGWSEDVMEARKRHNMATVADAGSTLLDRYIAENFRLVESHGEYHVLWRRDAPP